MPRGIIVVEMLREYIFMVYRGKERKKVLVKSGLSINKI